MKIAFVWQGSSDKRVFNHWNDGLREAMRIIERSHDVTYHEPFDTIENVDVILYWEAPCTVNGENADNYRKVQNNPAKKALLFAGGPISSYPQALYGFDLFFTESKINDDEFDALGLPHQRAFGINDRIFKAQDLEKEYDGMMQGTFASWKRHWLIAEALGNKAVLCGRKQENDRRPYDDSVRFGANIFPELSYENVAKLINKSHVVVNAADFWGGGQRCTLEAMACGVPVIVMTDSPKNIEYVTASGAGLIVNPDVNEIRIAVEELKRSDDDHKKKGIKYVKNNWTAKHYANSLLAGIEKIC